MSMRWIVTFFIGSVFIAMATMSASCGGDDDDDADAASTTKAVRLELAPIDVGAGGGAKASPPDGAACATTTMNALLTDAGIGPADVDLTDISLHSMKASYANASWSDDTEAVTAMLAFYGTQFPPVNVAAIDLDPGSADEHDVVVSPEVREFVEYFFTNRDEEFSHCVWIESTPSGFSATFAFVFVVNATTEPLP